MSMSKKPPQWTATEEHLLAQIYPSGGADACAAVMPGRSLHAIKQRASLLSIPAPCEVQDACPVPTHDYTAPDFAMRAWRYPVDAGQLRQRVVG